MGKAAKLNAALRAAEAGAGAVATVARPAPLPPRPAIERWAIDKQLRVTPTRRAMFARPLGRKRLACDLCYKACELAPGEAGWCNYRRNDNGQMAIPEHGLLARCQRLILGYGGGIHTFLPGAPALGVGATKCTARCSFCTSADIVWQPEKIKWLTHERGPATDADLYYSAKGYLHPEAVIEYAHQRQARAIVFAENEPTLSFEYTYDVARLAKSEGLLIGSTEDRCVMYQTYCDCWDHTQFVTDGWCDHCGTDVPVVTLPLDELAAFRATIAGNRPA